jgi:hypothetical protein
MKGAVGEPPSTAASVLNPVKPLIFVLLLGAASLLGWLLLTNGHAWGDDFAAYLLQAQAIVEGTPDEFLTRNSFTIENSKPGLGPVVYPWGYPLVLAPLVAWLGLDLFAIKLLNLCFYALFLVVTYFLFRNRLSFIETCLVVAVFAVHPAMLNSVNEIHSDLVFLLLSTLSMLLIDRWITFGAAEMTWLKGVTLGLAVFAAFQVRTTGALLLVVLLVSQSVEGFRLRRMPVRFSNYALLIHASAYLVVIVLWLLFNQILPAGGEGYLGQLSLEDIPRTAYRNLALYAKELLPSFLDALPFSRQVYWILLTLSAIGALVNFRRDYAFCVYCITAAAVYLLWPYTQGLRFLFPLLPFWVYFIVRGIQWLLSRLPGVHIRSSQSAARLVPAVVLLFVIAFFFSATLQLARMNLERGRQTGGPFSPESAALFRAVSENTPQGSVVSFSNRARCAC